jgi:hypothetical protein
MQLPIRQPSTCGINIQGGGVNQHAPKQEGANLDTPQKIYNCIYCQIDSHHTVDCRKLISARKLATEHFTKKDSGYPASACYVARSVFDWFADSGATSHMTDQLSLLMDYQPIELGSWMVTGIGGTSLPVHGQGSVRVITEVQPHLYIY